ncbi:MAG: glycosyltransferase [Rhodobacter sp.]|nr:glycosyltransferase [Paracoccaceae bacterium]MCC0077397.1 glycosyltransferase [Rhodobacter sp.]
MAQARAEDWISRQGIRPARLAGLVTDPDGARHVTLMNLVFRDDYGLAHKTSVALAPCPAASPDRPLALSFDSHSNAFPEDFYCRIGVTQAVFRATLRAASCRVRVIRRDPAGKEQLLAEADGHGDLAVSMPVDLLPGGSRCIVQIDATPDLTILQAGWTAPAPDICRPLGLSITTYNKEPYLRANLQTILDSTPAQDGLLEVLVVNNGRPIDSLPGTVTVITRDNIGGTGGFITAYEHFRQRGFAHFLVMDDDILIAPDFLERIYAISCFARGVHVGAIAEIQNTPKRRIKEQGARISRSEVMGLELHNEDLLLDGPDLPRLYAAEDSEYGGWWGLLVDLSAPRRLPPAYFFIKRDDISFGVDSAAAGCPTLVFPNLHVTHSEIGSPVYFYFDVRNDLVMRARSDPPMPLDPWHLRVVANWCLVTLQPDRQQMLNRAIRDFLRGPEALAALDPHALLADLRQLADPAMPWPADAPVLTVADAGQHGRAVDFLRWRSYRQDGPVPVIVGNPTGLTGGRAAYYEGQPGTDTVRLHKRRFRSLWHYLHTLILLRRLKRRYPAMQERYARP